MHGNMLHRETCLIHRQTCYRGKHATQGNMPNTQGNMLHRETCLIQRKYLVGRETVKYASEIEMKALEAKGLFRDLQVNINKCLAPLACEA